MACPHRRPGSRPRRTRKPSSAVDINPSWKRHGDETKAWQRRPAATRERQATGRAADRRASREEETMAVKSLWGCAALAAAAVLWPGGPAAAASGKLVLYTSQPNTDAQQ